MPELVLAWRLTDRTAKAVAEGANLTIVFGDGARLRLDLPSSDAAAALARVAAPGGLSEPDLAGLPDAARALSAIERVRLTGGVEWLAIVGGRCFARIVPLTHRFEPDAAPPVMAGEGRPSTTLSRATGEVVDGRPSPAMSVGDTECSAAGIAAVTTVPSGLAVDRFAYLRRDGDTAVLESSEAGCRLVLKPAAAAAVARLIAGEATAEDEPALDAAGTHRLPGPGCGARRPPGLVIS